MNGSRMFTRETTRYRGVTLIEVLVAVTIVGLLLAILLPAVMSARESSRRAACANNLRQIGIAINAFQTTNGHTPSGRGASFHIRVLPFLEHSALHNSINVSNFGINQFSSTLNNIWISEFICPSDPLDRRGPATTNYVGCVGTHRDANGPHVRDGYFGKISRNGNIPDGAAFTIAVSEWARGAAADPLSVVFHSERAISDRKEFIGACSSMRFGVDRSYPKELEWYIGELGRTLYNHLLVPNKPSCSNAGGTSESAWTASSRHSGGVNALFADGRVSFIKDTVTEKTWNALGTKDSGDQLGSDF